MWSEIVFDHCHGNGKIIKDKPSNWLRTHKLTDENIAIWEQEDFGILCNRCNVQLPTLQREAWLHLALDYTLRKKS